MKFIKKHETEDNIVEFVKDNLEILMKKPLNEGAIVGTIESKSDAHALSMCRKIDNVISALTMIKEELGFSEVPNPVQTTQVHRAPTPAPVSHQPTYQMEHVPMTPPAPVGIDDPVMPKSGAQYRNSLAEAIRATNTAQGINSTQGGL